MLLDLLKVTLLFFLREHKIWHLLILTCKTVRLSSLLSYSVLPGLRVSCFLRSEACGASTSNADADTSHNDIAYESHTKCTTYIWLNTAHNHISASDYISEFWICEIVSGWRPRVCLSFLRELPLPSRYATASGRALAQRRRRADTEPVQRCFLHGNPLVSLEFCWLDLKFFTAKALWTELSLKLAWAPPIQVKPW